MSCSHILRCSLPWGGGQGVARSAERRSGRGALPPPAPSLWLGKAARLRYPRPPAGEPLSSLAAGSRARGPATRALGGLGRGQPSSPPLAGVLRASSLPFDLLPLSLGRVACRWVGAKLLPPPGHKPRRLVAYLLRCFLSQPLFYLSCLFP